jgi:hypothetical protein
MEVYYYYGGILLTIAIFHQTIHKQRKTPSAAPSDRKRRRGHAGVARRTRLGRDGTESDSEDEGTVWVGGTVVPAPAMVPRERMQTRPPGYNSQEDSLPMDVGDDGEATTPKSFEEVNAAVDEAFLMVGGVPNTELDLQQQDDDQRAAELDQPPTEASGAPETELDSQQEDADQRAAQLDQLLTAAGHPNDIFFATEMLLWSPAAEVQAKLTPKLRAEINDFCGGRETTDVLEDCTTLDVPGVNLEVKTMLVLLALLTPTDLMRVLWFLGGDDVVDPATLRVAAQGARPTTLCSVECLPYVPAEVRDMVVQCLENLRNPAKGDLRQGVLAAVVRGADAEPTELQRQLMAHVARSATVQVDETQRMCETLQRVAALYPGAVVGLVRGDWTTTPLPELSADDVRNLAAIAGADAATRDMYARYLGPLLHCNVGRLKKLTGLPPLEGATADLFLQMMRAPKLEDFKAMQAAVDDLGAWVWDGLKGNDDSASGRRFKKSPAAKMQWFQNLVEQIGLARGAAETPNQFSYDDEDDPDANDWTRLSRVLTLPDDCWLVRVMTAFYADQPPPADEGRKIKKAASSTRGGGKTKLGSACLGDTAEASWPGVALSNDGYRRRHGLPPLQLETPDRVPGLRHPDEAGRLRRHALPEGCREIPRVEGPLPQRHTDSDLGCGPLAAAMAIGSPLVHQLMRIDAQFLQPTDSARLYDKFSTAGYQLLPYPVDQRSPFEAMQYPHALFKVRYLPGIAGRATDIEGHHWIASLHGGFEDDGAPIVYLYLGRPGARGKDVFMRLPPDITTKRKACNAFFRHVLGVFLEWTGYFVESTETTPRVHRSGRVAGTHTEPAPSGFYSVFFD